MKAWCDKGWPERLLVIMAILFLVWETSLLIAACIVEPTVENFIFIFKLMFWSSCPIAFLAFVFWGIDQVKEG